MFPLVESQFRGGASSFFYMKHHRHWQEVMDSDSLELLILHEFRMSELDEARTIGSRSNGCSTFSFMCNYTLGI